MKSASPTNNNPRLVKKIVLDGYFKNTPLKIIDIGARGGIEDHWSKFFPDILIYGFESDLRECQRLNKIYKNNKFIFLPYALSDKNDSRIFYITNYKDSSGFYIPDFNFWKRFPDEINLKVRKTVKIKTYALDFIAKKNNFGEIDFVKLDVEGAEFDIIKGAKKVFNDVLGLSIEVEFFETHKGQKTFSEVDKLLRLMGFKLYDIYTYRHARKTLPEINPRRVGYPTKYGQVIWGQALYFRDPLESNKFIWNEQKLLKISCLFNLFNLNDCSIEAVNLLTNKNKVQFLNLLTPDKYTYKEYLDKVKEASKKGFTSEAEHIRIIIQKFARQIIPLKTRKLLGRQIDTMR